MLLLEIRMERKEIHMMGLGLDFIMIVLTSVPVSSNKGPLSFSGSHSVKMEEDVTQSIMTQEFLHDLQGDNDV
jgi:hypothetical protein